MKALSEPLTGIYEWEIPETDPATGRKTLYVNGTYTQCFRRIHDRESRPILEYFCAHATRAELTARVRSQPGTVTFWENQSMQHLPINDYHGFRCEMHRVTVDAVAAQGS